MKKIMVMMVLSMVICAMIGASAELNFKTYSKEKSLLGVKHDGTEVWDERYYVIATSSHGDGEAQVLEVTEEEYNEILQAEKKAERKAAFDAKPWYGKVASFATFWNPND